MATIPAVDGLSKVGFEVIATYSGGQKKFDVSGTQVYTSVNALGESVSANSLGGKVVYALVIEDIPVSAGEVTYTVKPYTIAQGTTAKTYGVEKTIPVAN